MNHQTKTSLFQLLDMLPSKLGYYIYHQLQNIQKKDLEKIILSNQKSVNQISQILEHVNENMIDKNILEVGSGWSPLFPYLLKIKAKYRDIYTYDINQHYQKEKIVDLNATMTSKFNLELGSIDSKYSLPHFVKYFPNSNIINEKLPHDIDLVISRFVLEHVTPEDILKMHVKFHSDLKKEVFVLHLISPSDHRSYSDKSISNYDFLQYSQAQWDKIQTKFDYHNRLRLPQYLELFDQAGFEIVYKEYSKVDRNSEKYKKFKNIKIHPDFSKYSEEDILASSINVLLRKK